MARKKSRPDDTDPIGPARAEDGTPAPAADAATHAADEIDLAALPPTPEPPPVDAGTFEFAFAPHPDDDKPVASAEIPIPPVATVVPPPAPASSPELDAMGERMKRLEETLARLAQIQSTEQRVVEHLADRIQTTPSSPTIPSMPAAPPPTVNPVAVLGAAQTLMDAGRHILPNLGPSGPMLTAGPRPAGGNRRGGFAELVAEFQGMYYMYTDPRYRLSWLGRIAAPVLAAAFATADYWVQYVACGLGAIPFVAKPLELLLAFGLIRVLTSESRRYRETAPELPASLRL